MTISTDSDTRGLEAPDTATRQTRLDATVPLPTHPEIRPANPAAGFTFEELIERTPPESRDLVRHAHDFAFRLHEGQHRLSGEPYIQHPITVACYLAELRMDGPTIAAGLLHDVLEDTDISLEEFSQHFPDPVPDLVQGVTKITKMNFETTRDAQVENLRLMLLAMARDIRVVIIKLCDRLHNMQTLRALPEEKRIRISQETIDIYAPLANRLGMSQIKSDLEDLSMRWLHPEHYQEISRKVALKRGERERLVTATVDFLRRHLAEDYPNAIVTGRPKHFYSIYKKMLKSGLSFEQIFDLNAIRIICEEESQCYDILGRIHALWKPVPGRFRDYVALPKKNLYQSIHTTVIGLNGAITEIQIRTRDMHQVAELGIAAHWSYKERGVELQNDERLAWLRQLAEWITDPKESEGLMEALKSDVFADRVLCFTPKGDVIELPADATPIDFAYAIHTKVGEHCVGAIINGRMVNLRAQLQNGDVVDIQTAANGHPSRDWIQYVKTGRARTKIKHWLKARNVDEWVETGRRSLNTVLRERGATVSQQELDKALTALLPAYKMQTVDDLLVEIGFGSISPQAALARANPDWLIDRRKEARRKKAAAKGPSRRRGPESIVHIEGAEGAPVKVASCCAPIPGDAIVGYVTRGRGITVHKVVCRNIERARREPEEAARLLPAHWNGGDEGATYNVTLRVEAEDREGLLTSITGIISSAGLFIDGSHTKSDHSRGVAILNFDVRVRDVSQLESVLTTLRNDPSVIVAERRKAGII